MVLNQDCHIDPVTDGIADLDSTLLSIPLQIPLWAFVLLTISRTPLATAQQADLDIDDEGGGGGLLDGLEGGEDEQELALQEEKRKSKTSINLHDMQRAFCRSYFNMRWKGKGH